jgi:hypothetical protein
MIDIPITSHDFRKVNAATIIRGGRAYDIYRCEVCGLEGKRYGFSDLISVQRDKLNCSHRKRMMAGKVCINKKCVQHLKSQFGLCAGVEYEVVEPPEDYKGKYPESVWVFSKKRGEPVRLLADEFYYCREAVEAGALNEDGKELLKYLVPKCRDKVHKNKPEKILRRAGNGQTQSR